MSRAAAPVSFLYLALRARGGRKLGIRQARSSGALAEALRRESLLLLRWWTLPSWLASETRLTIKDHAALNEQLAQLLSRGVPLVEALDVTAQTVRPAARPRIERLRERVAAGASFADACAGVGGFDDVTIAVYRGAERTGDLAGAAARLGQTMRRRLALSGKAGTLMVYPVVVLSISALVAVIMLMVVVPRLGDALQAADMKLPGYSRLVMAVGSWMRGHAGLIGLLAAALLAGLLVVRRAVADLAARLARRLPLFKQVVLAQESARFFAVMGAMVRSGIPIADALGVANQAVTHPTLRAQLERLRTRLVSGGLLPVLIEEVTSLPLATRRLMIAADRSGDLESAFSTLAADLSDEVDRRASRALAALEPLLIVVMFLLIGSLLVSVLLPMLTLGGRVGR
ncbi:MAG TPA: type II secretion system F family protein [Phycisphaerales bacterium]|nr:type II secretion system F family protein [Phycisphaerales bacterium]